MQAGIDVVRAGLEWSRAPALLTPGREKGDRNCGLAHRTMGPREKEPSAHQLNTAYTLFLADRIAPAFRDSDRVPARACGSAQRSAASGADHLARDVGRFRRRQKHIQRRNLDGLASTPGRRVLAKVLDMLRREGAGN